MTQFEILKAQANAMFLSDKELDIAYNQASVNGWGDLCDIYFQEHNKRIKNER
tara:strand:- start:18575 stop:18733 length:159 start_codon:yes stop_codon:yes gene_type:complete